MPRLVVDASCLIALGKIGALPLLEDLPREVATTAQVIEEATAPGYPESGAIEKAAEADWLTVETADAPESGDELGLGAGEASLLSVCGDEDLLVLDDGNARRAADARGFAYTGTIGLLVAAVDAEAVGAGRAVELLDQLSDTDFRITVELYRRAKETIESDR